MRVVLRISLLLLGIAIGWSAAQHWLPSAALVQHYRDVGIGEPGRITVAILQTAAALGLLVTRFQLVAATVLAAAMIVIAARNAFVGDLEKAMLPLAVAAWAALPAYWLRRHLRAAYPKP